MAKYMAERRGVKVRAADRCAYCGEPLGQGMLGRLRTHEYETAWDGQGWRPYHPVCWRVVRYPTTSAGSSWSLS